MRGKAANHSGASASIPQLNFLPGLWVNQAYQMFVGNKPGYFAAGARSRHAHTVENCFLCAWTVDFHILKNLRLSATMVLGFTRFV